MRHSMKAKILDGEALRAVSPEALMAFARGEGWTKTDVFGMHADVYCGDDRTEIIIPRTDCPADYASVVSRLIDVFAKVTKRDELAIYRVLAGSDRAFGGDDDKSDTQKIG